MSNPKRKVTDLLPSEAILISSDADLKVLEEFEKAGITWIDGALATSFNPLSFSGEENVIIHIELERIVWAYTEGSELTIYPATDFIPTESDEVVGSGIVISEPDDSFTIRINPDYERQLLVDYHNFILDDPKAKECDVVGESVELFLKTRNTPNQ